MLKYSYIVFAHAILLSFEAIFAEFIQNSLQVSVITITSISFQFLEEFYCLFILHQKKMIIEMTIIE